MTSTTLSITLGLAVVLGACCKATSDRPGTGPAPSPPTPGAEPAAPAAPLDPTAIAPGTTCPEPAQRVDAPLTIDGARLSFTYTRGGGCPTGPVYTVLYSAANPTEVRVCYDQRADTCKMLIHDEHVNLDLGGVLAATGATSAVIAP